MGTQAEVRDPRSFLEKGADELDIHVLEWSCDGVPLILLHGFSNEAHIWDDFAPEVAPFYRVLAVDLRGHGKSDWDPEARYEYERHVDDLECVTEALGIERAVIVGHSFGSRVATLFAARHPERMAGLVIVDAGPETDRRGSARIRMDVEEHLDPSFGSVEEFETYLAHAYPAATATAIARMAVHGVKPREDGRFVLRMDPALRGAVGSRLSADEMAKQEEENTRALWSALEKIPCPTLVVRGAASDILSAEVADKMVEEALPKGELAVVGQAGHSVMTDNPRGFRDAVCRFVLGE